MEVDQFKVMLVALSIARGQAFFMICHNALICLHDFILLYRLSRSNLSFEPKNKLKVYFLLSLSRVLNPITIPIGNTGIAKPL